MDVLFDLLHDIESESEFFPSGTEIGVASNFSPNDLR